MDLLDVLWVLLCGFMVLDMQAGFLCLETGLARAKNASNIALKNVSDICFATLAFWAIGFGLMFGASHNGLFGTSLFASGWDSRTFEIAPFLFFQMAFATTAVTIISGAVAERAAFGCYLLVSATTAAIIYPIVGHAAWAGVWLEGQSGWLEALGFLDFAGGTVVHSVGGWAALTFCIVLGPRRGRFQRGSRRFEPSSMSTAALGVIFLWIGWAGFNAGSALALDAAVGPIILRTMLGAAAGGAITILLSIALFRFASAQLTLNGVIAGLVSGTAGINLYTGMEAILVGAAGAAVMVAASFWMRRLHIDDVVDAVPVHLAPGIVGTLLLPFFADASALPAGSVMSQLGVQGLGVVFAGVWTVTMTVLVLAIISRLVRVRVTARQEVLGLDAAEHNIGNAFLELIEEMKRHQLTGSFTTRVTVERSSDVGMLAYRYNKVLDRVESEIGARIKAMRREQAMRKVAEDAFVAMKDAQTESAHAARHDGLTGLGNRLLLDEIASSDESLMQTSLMVLAIDLDRFKSINDRHGHDAGDAVLIETANRIRSVIRQDRDFGFRIGGDEFVLLLDWTGAKQKADAYCDALSEKLSAKIHFNRLTIDPGASIGFATANGGNTELHELIKQADMALYEAKNAGRGRSIAYREDIGARYSSHVNELALFRHALDGGQIVAYVQPQVDAITHNIVGCEFLARWQHPHKGLLSPDHFLPLAEELDITAELDREILRQALAFHEAAGAGNFELKTISVNVSAKRLSSPDLLDDLRGWPNLPDGLTFEILETANLDIMNLDLKDTVKSLKSLGIQIEVDDFGTGHASLASILALEPNALKIDRMFVADITRNPARADLLQSLIGIAARFGAATVVEGVETMEEAALIAQMGADRLQGFAFARPMSIGDTLEYLMSTHNSKDSA